MSKTFHLVCAVLHVPQVLWGARLLALLAARRVGAATYQCKCVQFVFFTGAVLFGQLPAAWVCLL